MGEEAFKPVAAKQVGIDLEDVELLKEARAVGISSDEIRELIALRRTDEAFPNASSADPDRRSSIASHVTQGRSDPVPLVVWGVTYR